MQMGMESDLFMGTGTVWYVGLTNAGRLDPAVIGVINLGPNSFTGGPAAHVHVSVPGRGCLACGLLLPRVPPSSLGW